MNIIAFFGVTTYPDPLILLELMSGGSLHDALHPNRLMPSVCWRISKDIAAGLLYLHTRAPPMVHRDLTSSNVLLTAPVAELALREVTDNTAFAKLSDFGLTRSTEFYMTACTGNLYFSAPETFKGDPHSPASDVYSLAILLYEVFTSKVPFEGEGAQRVAFQVSQEGRRPSVDDLEQSDCPPSLVSVITQLWAQEPSERPSLPMLQQVLDDVGSKAGWLRTPDLATQSPVQEQQEEAMYDEWAQVQYDDFREAVEEGNSITDKELLAERYDRLLSSQLEQQREGMERWQQQQQLVRAEIQQAMGGAPDAYSLHDEARWKDVAQILIRHLTTRPTVAQLASRR